MVLAAPLRKVADTSVDVLIVGAGISGALMALSLANRGLKVLVLDRRQPLHGSSLASTAMIQHEIDVPLHKLASMIGGEKARWVWQRSAQAVETRTELVDHIGIACRLERKNPSILLEIPLGAGTANRNRYAFKGRPCSGISRSAPVAAEVCA